MKEDRGYLPPQAIDLEEAVLAAALTERDGTRSVLNYLKSDQVFYKAAHQTIFRAIKDIFQEGIQPDLLTVVQKLIQFGELEKVGGAYAVSGLATRINSFSNVERYCAILLEKFTRRQIIDASHRLIEKAYDDTQDVFDLLSENQQSLNRLNDALSIREPQTLESLYYPALEQIGQATTQKGITGVPCGISSIDRLSGGWQPCNLIIVAARPGMGKTSFMLNVARNAAIDFNRPGAIFSLEMSAMELTKKLMATESNYSTSQLNKGDIMGGTEGLNDLARLTNKLVTRKLIIDDDSGLTISLLRAKATKLKADKGIEWLMIDYLQLMSGESKGSREQEIAGISRGLKKLAKELNIPIIALSQLSRSVETRGGDKRPLLSDLRESGAIEQDADVVIFLFRPEYYGITEDETGNPTNGIAEVDFAKHRNGPVDKVITACDIQYGKFSDLTLYRPEYKPTPLPESNFEEIEPAF